MPGTPVGDRVAGVKDPHGNDWYIGTHLEDVSPEETRRRAARRVRVETGDLRYPPIPSHAVNGSTDPDRLGRAGDDQLRKQSRLRAEVHPCMFGWDRFRSGICGHRRRELSSTRMV